MEGGGPEGGGGGAEEGRGTRLGGANQYGWRGGGEGRTICEDAREWDWEESRRARTERVLCPSPRRVSKPSSSTLAPRAVPTNEVEQSPSPPSLSSKTTASASLPRPSSTSSPPLAASTTGACSFALHPRFLPPRPDHVSASVIRRRPPYGSSDVGLRGASSDESGGRYSARVRRPRSESGGESACDGCPPRTSVSSLPPRPAPSASSSPPPVSARSHPPFSRARSPPPAPASPPPSHSPSADSSSTPQQHPSPPVPASAQHRIRRGGARCCGRRRCGSWRIESAC